MLSVLRTTALSFLSKAKVWAIAGGVLLLSVLLTAAKVYNAGREHERLAQANSTIKQYQKESRIEADIRSLGADAARKRLRDKWGKR